MIQVCKLLIILLSIFGLSCTANKGNNVTEELSTTKTMDSVEKKYIYGKIEYFIDKYSIGKNESIIDDSLCFYMAKLDRKELIKNDSFRALMGKLLEKKYLAVRNSGTFPPETFPVYNASILYDARMSNGFALKIVIGEKFNIDSTFNIYAHPWREFLCIDSVVLVLDKLPQMQTDSNHQKCMYLVKNYKTGGCKW